MSSLRVPTHATIASDKLTRYLLLPRQRNDKSGFLAQAGFAQENPDLLTQAIRRLAFENDAIIDRENEYGRFFRVEGDLVGPSGTLHVVTVWIETATGEVRFVTLKPARYNE